MPRDGPKAVPEGKGPSPRVEPGKTVDITAVMEMLQKLNSHFDKMDSHSRNRSNERRYQKNVSMDYSNSYVASLLKRTSKERRLASVTKAPS